MILVQWDSIGKIKVIENLHWLVLFTQTGIVALEVFRGSSKVKQMDDMIVKGIYNYEWGSWEEDIMFRSRAQRVLNIFGYFFCVSMIMAGLVQFVRAGFFDSRRKGWDLFFTGWTPFEVNSNLTYYTANGYQLLVAVCVVFSLTSQMSVFCAVSEHLMAHLKVLKSAFHQFVERNRGEKEIEFNTAITACVKHHQILLKYFDLIQSFSNFILMGVTINMGLILCTIVYVITDPSSTAPIITTFAVVMVPEMTIPVAFSWYGQMISDESASVGDAIYDLRWYDMTPKERRILQLIMLRCRKPMILTGCGLKEFSLEGFKDMMAATYSYFNMLLVARKD